MPRRGRRRTAIERVAIHAWHAAWKAHGQMITYAPCGDRCSVSGIGVVSAFGTTHDAFRDGLLEGRSGIAPADRVRDRRLPNDAGRTARRTSSPPDWVPPMKLRRLDRTGSMPLRPRSWRSRMRGTVDSATAATTSRRRARHVDGRWTIDAGVSRRAVSRRADRRHRRSCSTARSATPQRASRRWTSSCAART